MTWSMAPPSGRENSPSRFQFRPFKDSAAVAAEILSNKKYFPFENWVNI